MRAFFIIMAFTICSVAAYPQSINGGYGQGLVNMVPDNGSEFRNGFKNIKPDANLGFWRLSILPRSSGRQGLAVTFEFNIDKPARITGSTTAGGSYSTFYNPDDFQTTINGSIEFLIEGYYMIPSTGKKVTFECRKTSNNLGKTVISGELFTRTSEAEEDYSRMKISQQPNPLATFLSQFKVQVTSIKAVSRNYRGFAKMDIELGKRLDQKRKAAESTAQADSYLRQGHVQYGIRDYDGAKKLYQKAYALNKDPKTLKLVEDTDKAIAHKAEQERLQKVEEAKKAAAAAQQKNANNSSSNSPSPSSGPVLTSSSTKTGKSTTAQNKSTTASQNSSNFNETTNSPNKKEETSGKTYQQMLYEREVYKRQQQEKIQNAVDPTRQAMQPVRNYFDAQIDKINREAAAKEAREEREWLARKRREEAEERRRQQEYEERKRKEELFNNKMNAIRSFLTEHGYYAKSSLPNSSTHVNSNKLYYFAYYTDHGSHTKIEDARLQITNVFTIVQYPDGTWPYANAIKSDLNKIMTLSPSYLIRGYFTSEQKAIAERNAFVAQFKSVGVRVEDKFYAGKNTNASSTNNAKVDYWGNPVKKPKTNQSKPGTSQQKKQKLDYWGNPVKN